MGKKDILDKKFFEDRERFAELVNTELYHGKKILIPEKMELLRRSYPSIASVSGEKTRDVMMLDTGQNICYGLEIETESDHSMPERVMTYDASEYECQIRELDKSHRERKEYKDYRSRKSRMKENDFLLPTVTMVLYLGEGQWQGKRKLLELFGIPKEIRQQLGRFLRNYEFPLIEANSVDPENYDTDLREFFQAMQCRGDLARLEEMFRMENGRSISRETELVIAAHLGNKLLFQQVEEGMSMSMCKALKDLRNEERAIGRQEGQKVGQKKGRREGIRIGRQEERFQTMQKMLQAGLAENLIMSILNCTKEELAAAGK